MPSNTGTYSGCVLVRDWEGREYLMGRFNSLNEYDLLLWRSERIKDIDTLLVEGVVNDKPVSGPITARVASRLISTRAR